MKKLQQKCKLRSKYNNGHCILLDKVPTHTDLLMLSGVGGFQKNFPSQHSERSKFIQISMPDFEEEAARCERLKN